MKILALLFLLLSCTHGPGGPPREGKTTYAYSDVSGRYKLVHEFKNIKQKLISRNQILSTSGSGSRVLEKSIIVSRLGSIQDAKKRLMTLRPEASEFTVWLEGKKYSSRMDINPKKKSMRVKLESPETKWNGVTEIPFPKAKYFCFFNQLAECLFFNHFLDRAFEQKNQRLDFYIIWDNYPFVQDQLTGIGKNLFSPATIKFDGAIKNTFRYIVDVEGQLIVYQFSKDLDWVRMAWIAQGISVLPPGEEIASDE